MPQDEQRLRIEEWMSLVRDELVGLMTDEDTYWRTQSVIQENPRLLTMRSPFFDLFNDSYVYATVMGLRRVTEKSQQVVSLRNVLHEIRQYPQLAPQVDKRNLEQDILALDGLANNVREYADKYVAHHDRKRMPAQITFGDLRRWLADVREIFGRYYALLFGSDIDLIVSYLEDPMTIFTFPWIQPNASS